MQHVQCSPYSLPHAIAIFTLVSLELLWPFWLLPDHSPLENPSLWSPADARCWLDLSRRTKVLLKAKTIKQKDLASLFAHCHIRT